MVFNNKDIIEILSNGRRIQIEKPVKTFKHKKLKRKCKYGPKLQRVKYHSGWCEMIEDGRVIMLDNKMLVMNEKTWNSINKQIKK